MSATATGQALDAYSRAVVAVAAELVPKVASLRVGRGGAGSAVRFSADGLLLTSAHVVARNDRVTARFDDGTEGTASVVGRDRLSDLAVVRLDAAGPSSEPARLGDADALVVGQLVVAIGSPLGYEGSVSAGVVSGLGRSLMMGDGQHQRLVENVIQTDASLHPGNSGGALADATGAVVGINTAVVGPGIGQGLGLAVPIDAHTRAIIGQLVRDGRVSRAWLGIGGGTRSLPASLASSLGRTTALGVTSVVSGSPAADSGLVPGDLLLALDDVPIGRIVDLQRLLDGERQGRQVTLTVLRDGRTDRVTVTPGTLV